MSITIESYSQGNIYVEYRWDKHNGWEMFVGHKVNDLMVTDYHNTYINKECAKRAFQRQVKKIKKN